MTKQQAVSLLEMGLLALFPYADPADDPDSERARDQRVMREALDVLIQADLLAALRGVVAEFDKFSRYGSPIAGAANEAVLNARAAIAKATAALSVGDE